MATNASQCLTSKPDISGVLLSNQAKIVMQFRTAPTATGCLKSSASRCIPSLPQQAILSVQGDPTQGFTARAQAALACCLAAAQEAPAPGPVLTTALGPAWRQPGQAVRLCLELLPEGGPEEELRWGLEALLLPACQAVQAATCRTLMEGLKTAGEGLTRQAVQGFPCTAMGNLKCR